MHRETLEGTFGDVEIVGDILLTGMAVGDVRVNPGSVLVLTGLVRGNIELDAQAVGCEVAGYVTGDVTVFGGTLKLKGHVGGTVFSSPQAEVLVYPGAALRSLRRLTRSDGRSA